MSLTHYLVIPVFCLVAVKTQANVNKTTSIQQIRQEIELFVQAKVDEVLTNYDEVQINISYLDKRLKMKACDQPIQISKRYGHINQGRMTVEVSCQKPVNWRLRVPVNIKVFKDIFITNDLLKRGQTIGQQDIMLSRQDITHDARGYFESDHELIGKVVYRTMRQGTIIKPSMIREATLIKRGSTVDIISSGNGIMVKSSGIAMKDGIKGEIITIKNKKSKRTIDGRVTAAGTVQVNL